MEYLTVKETALKWNISERSVQNYCANQKIPDAKCIGKQWMIPASSERPSDGRLKSAKGHQDIYSYHFPLFVHSSFFTNKYELSKEEIDLYDAQILYITGNYCDCIIKCRQLQSSAISQSVIFGLHCTVGYASMLLGIYTDYQNSIYAMERIIDKETTHKEDYRLLLVGLQAHASRNYTLISDIDTEKLSFDSLYYHRYLLMMHSLVNLTVESNNTINSYLSLLRELEIKGITPTALCINCMLSFLFKRLGDKGKQQYYMQKACAIEAEAHYYSLFAKYYVLQPALIDEILLKYDEDHKNATANVSGNGTPSR